MYQSLSSTQLKEKIDFYKKNQTLCLLIIDVRTKLEHQEQAFDDFLSNNIVYQNIPVADFKTMSSQEFNSLFHQYHEVIIHCQSGSRSKTVCELIDKLMDKQNIASMKSSIFNLEGGFLGCLNQGFSIKKTKKSGIPLMRQVFIAASSLILLGLTLFHLGIFSGIYLVWFVALGLMTSGLTGFCGMALLLEKMPWNKITSN